MSQSQSELGTSNIFKMSEYETEFVEVKSEPVDMYPESKNEHTVEGLSFSQRPAELAYAVKAAKDEIKHLKKKTKRSNAAGSYVCLLCNKEYIYEAFLTRHMVSKHRACEPIHQYRCRQCGAIFADEAGFEKHKSLFFEFLRHHIERVKPKEIEQLNEVSEFEEFVKATAEKGEDEEEEAEDNIDAAGRRQEENADCMESGELVDSVFEDLNGPAEKKRKEETDTEWKETATFLITN